MALNAELEGFVARLTSLLASHGPPGAGQLIARLVVERAPDERMALVGLLGMAENSPRQMAQALANPELAADLIFCLGASEMIGGYLVRKPQWLAYFGAARTENADTLPSSFEIKLTEPLEREAARRELADQKQGHFIRIAIADLLARLDVNATMVSMSRLADQTIAAALHAALGLVGELGRSLAGFCVVALGKLGVDELNLSSDVDLAYLYEPADPRTAERAAARVGELTTELLADSFRVDLRLRPGGTHAPLVASLETAVNFYQSFGQTWERAALLRVRPVAGQLELARQWLRELGNFIYRHYLDFETLRQLRAMKGLIEAEFRTAATSERNIKLGRGGIRELEFIVQALTLVYGGRDPRLRYPQTLAALQQLERFDYIPGTQARRLAQAYLFLRDVEHKLQVVAGRQTHELPADETGMARLAARLGLGKNPSSLKLLRDVLQQHRAAVSDFFRGLFATELERDTLTHSPAASAAWDAALEPELSAPMLGELGFSRPAESANHLVLLARGPAHALASPRRKELLSPLGPLLLDELARQADPDLSLMHLAAFMAAVGARTSFLELLGRHPATREVLLRLFASSRYLSTVFINHPEMLDVLVRSDLARQRRSTIDLGEELSELLSHAPDFESALDSLRSFRQQEFLRIAIADLGEQLDLDDVQRELSNLAEAVLRQALELARTQVAPRFPILNQLALCAIAMGRLGAGEMTYSSDLDLIFVYRDPPAAEEAEVAREAAARLVQKLVGVLETRTREGLAYRIDLRLRPSGNAGPLVASLSGFRQYHQESSATWERQALSRGRVITGDPGLGAEVEAARLEFVFARGLRQTEVEEIAAMRQRIERELGTETGTELNLKQGRGGLLDIEFLVQMLALRYGAGYPDLRQRRTADLLAALRRSALLAAADADALAQDYEFLLTLESRVRMESGQAGWPPGGTLAQLQPLARQMGFAGANPAAQMLSDLSRRRAQVRELFERYFAAERERPQS